MKVITIGVMLWLVFNNFIACEKKAVPPEPNQLESPSNFSAASGFRAIKLFWTPVEAKNVAGYRIYYSKTSKSYKDTLLVTREISQQEITGLEDDQRYSCSITTVDNNNHESDFSEEISIRTYLAFEDFTQPTGVLDTLKWYYNVGYTTPVINDKVAAIETQFENDRVTMSFGQYLKYTPTDSFIVECDFKLGTPNIGGAGLMIRSEKANPEMYYKGYNAFVFWNLNNWELRLEESLADRQPMSRAIPIKLLDIGSNEWVKLSISYKNSTIQASLFRLPGYQMSGTIVSDDKNTGQRPYSTDIYCGFFTTQYGRNIIYSDNFGIRRTD